MTALPLRLFVPAGSCEGGALVLDGAEAARLCARGVREGDTIVVLDDSGWAMTVAIQACTPTTCRGRVTGRNLGRERRTKVSLYQGLLHPSDFRRLLVRATALGVVAFVPMITDASMVPSLGADGRPDGETGWPDLVRDAAEAAGRGRRPSLGQALLFDHALDEAMRGGRAIVVAPDGDAPDAALTDRPFSIDVFCPPPGGFTPDERARALARGACLTRPPAAGLDPIEPALSLLDVIYRTLEGAPTIGGPLRA